MDETLQYLVRTWHHFGISDHNWTCPAKYPKNLRTFLRTETKNKNKNKIRLKFSENKKPRC